MPVGVVSFEFGETKYLSISIEARKESGERYSTLKGFFKQYELIYLVADERDVVRLRTKFRRFRAALEVHLCAGRGHIPASLLSAHELAAGSDV